MKKRGKKPGQTLLSKAKTQVKGFAEMYVKLEQKIKLNGMNMSTLANYSRCIAKISLYFGIIPIELEDEQINEYLLLLRDNQNLSKSFFKHTVYGLRYLFRMMDREDRAIQLPAIKRLEQLPVVLSKTECSRLFASPKLLKH